MEIVQLDEKQIQGLSIRTSSEILAPAHCKILCWKSGFHRV